MDMVGDTVDFERETTFCLKDASEIGAKLRPKTRRDRLGAAFCSKDQVVVEAGVGVRHDLPARWNSDLSPRSGALRLLEPNRTQRLHAGLSSGTPWAGAKAPKGRHVGMSSSALSVANFSRTAKQLCKNYRHGPARLPCPVAERQASGIRKFLCVKNLQP